MVNDNVFCIAFPRETQSSSAASSQNFLKNCPPAEAYAVIGDPTKATAPFFLESISCLHRDAFGVQSVNLHPIEENIEILCIFSIFFTTNRNLIDSLPGTILIE